MCRTPNFLYCCKYICILTAVYYTILLYYLCAVKHNVPIIKLVDQYCTILNGLCRFQKSYEEKPNQFKFFYIDFFWRFLIPGAQGFGRFSWPLSEILFISSLCVHTGNFGCESDDPIIFVYSYNRFLCVHRYYRRRVGPKVDVRLVLAVTISLISLGQVGIGHAHCSLNLT